MLKTVSETKQAVYQMLLENTGASILDSGSAYGRHWERNQKRTIEDFESDPVAWIDPEYGDTSKSLYHHLTSHLTYSAELSQAFAGFAEGYSEEGWLEIIGLWLDDLGVAGEGGDFYSDGRWNFNTYNFEYWQASQTVQGSFFGYGGREYLILQIHNGCDVRGGYTAPKVFEVGYDGRDGFIFEGERADFCCSSSECGNRLSVGPDGYELILDGESEETLDNPKQAVSCPCGGSWVA